MKYCYKNTAPKKLVMVSEDTDSVRLPTWATCVDYVDNDAFRVFADANSISYTEYFDTE